MSDPAPTIERLEPPAWARYRAIRIRALEDAPDAFGTRLEEDAAMPSAAWREQLAKPDHATFLAVLGGQDVGMAVGAAYRVRDGAAGLFGMWVAPEARRRGVGVLLVGAVVAWARAGAFDRIYLDVGDDNTPAVGLYARMGFEPTGQTGVVSPDRPHITEHERVLVL